MSERTIANISPIIIAGAVFVRLGWLLLLQHYAGFSPADLWSYWWVQLVIGAWQ